jgi:hypothetical protein
MEALVYTFLLIGTLVVIFFAILGGSLKNTDANSTARVPISKKVYTSVSMTS